MNDPGGLPDDFMPKTCLICEEKTWMEAAVVKPLTIASESTDTREPSLSIPKST